MTYLESTERSLNHSGVIAVDPNRARANSGRELHSLIDVLGENARPQAIVGVVTTFDDLIEALIFEDLHDGTEDFLLGNAHFVGDIGEDCRLNEVALLRHSLAAGNDLGALLDTGIDEIENLVSLELRDLWALVSLGVERIADDLGKGDLATLSDKLIVDGLVNICSSGGTATLTTVGHTTGVGDLGSLSNIDVFCDNNRRLATEFERNSLEGLGGDGLNLTANDSGASECNLVDAGVLANSSTSGLTEARNDVDHTGWEADLQDKAADEESGKL